MQIYTINNTEVVDFEHEGQKNWKLMFVWKQQVLRPTEEELKQAEGNMNILAIMLNKETRSRAYEQLLSERL